MRDAVRTAHSIAYIVHTSIRLNINTSYKYISSRYIRYVIVRQILQPQYPCISAARVCQTTITLIYTIIRHSLIVGPPFGAVVKIRTFYSLTSGFIRSDKARSRRFRGHVTQQSGEVR